jgi:hypothetical protein
MGTEPRRAREAGVYMVQKGTGAWRRVRGAEECVGFMQEGAGCRRV